MSEETLLADMVDDVLGGAADDGTADDGPPPVWRTVLEAGWPLVGVPEEEGGAGGDLADLVAIVSAAGRHGVRIPLVETAVAAWVLAGAGRGDLLAELETAAVAGHTAATVVVRDGTLSGVLDGVPWACAAGRLIVYAGGEPVLLDPGTPGVVFEPGTNVADEPRDRVRLDGVVLSAESTLKAAPGAGAVRARAGLLRAAAIVGAAEAALALTRDHVRTRHQFGRPLARIPAVASAVAIMASELVQARAAVHRAVDVHAVDGDRTDSPLAATAAARVCAGRAATTVARLAHQAHGAIGITREYPLHRHTRRLWAWRDEDGGEQSWAAWLGARAAGGSEQYLWDVLSSVPPLGPEERPI